MANSTNQIRDWWHLYRCSYGTSSFLWDRSPVYAQNTDWLRALEAAHDAAGYVHPLGGYVGSKRNCPAGIGGRPCQEDGDDCSLHNYGLAWDIDYQYNKHYKRPFTEAELDEYYRQGKSLYNSSMIPIIEAVRTTQGRQAFGWLGYNLGDLMHWQFNAPPEDQEIDWSTVGGEDMKWSDIVADETWAKAYEDGFIQGDPAVMPQYYFEGGPATEDEKKNAYNVIMQNQMEATK